ncbi:MAG: DUF2934 domain-containing protein [Opitutus sp.]|nr:DUF2934 domain-containing protein [Opitutus sp.]
MTTTHAPITHEDITRRAFDIWCENGRRLGTAEEDWRAAERQFEREREHVALTESQNAKDGTV